MSIEVVLFVVIGAIAVAAAVMMLLSENAVHSALFLILNFACVAFLFVLLDASFLALVQVAVYAGAIMVLFLFVIMLLGAERIGLEARQFKWLSPVALGLALAFLITVGVAVISGTIDRQEVPAGEPLVRVVHAAPDFPEADIYLNGELIASDVEFLETEATFTGVPEGEYAVSIALAGDEPELALPLGNVSLETGTAQTIVAYGEGRLPSLAVVAEDVEAITSRQGRLVVFNAYNVPVQLVDVGSDFEISDGEVAPVVIDTLQPGETSAPQFFDEQRPTWAFVQADSPHTIVLRLRDLQINRRDSDLLILGAERVTVDESLRPVNRLLATPAMPLFGGPQAIGMSLFTEYMLPFQLLALLLLAAMVGAIVLTQRADVKPKPGRPTRRKVSRPLTSVIASQTGHDVSGTPHPQLESPESADQPEPAGD